MNVNFDSLNTTGGHIMVCLVIAIMGAVLMWMGRSETSIFGVGLGLLQTGLGVAFRSMGMPNVATKQDATARSTVTRS